MTCKTSVVYLDNNYEYDESVVEFLYSGSESDGRFNYSEILGWMTFWGLSDDHGLPKLKAEARTRLFSPDLDVENYSIDMLVTTLYSPGSVWDASELERLQSGVVNAHLRAIMKGFRQGCILDGGLDDAIQQHPAFGRHLTNAMSRQILLSGAGVMARALGAAAAALWTGKTETAKGSSREQS